LDEYLTFPASHHYINDPCSFMCMTGLATWHLITILDLNTWLNSE